MKHQLLSTLLTSTLPQVHDTCEGLLLALYGEVVTKKGQYLYAKGTSPLCLVAHMDTVRDSVSSYTPTKIHGYTPPKPKTLRPVVIAVKGQVWRNRNGVLGADDRAGVYGILRVVERCHTKGIPMPSVIFTHGEEIGGRGVKDFIKDDVFDKTGINLFVELDRSGHDEFVFYSNYLPDEVSDYAKSFGYKEDWGSYSDITNLTDHYLIPSINVSIGYDHQHTQGEILHIGDMERNITRVAKMTEAPIKELYEIDPKKGSKYLNYKNYMGLMESVFPTPKEVFTVTTMDGLCPCCHVKWFECECGTILSRFIRELDPKVLRFVMSCDDLFDSNNTDMKKGISKHLYGNPKTIPF